jgi:ABC-2 type transport system ATP-binding protein
LTNTGSTLATSDLGKQFDDRWVVQGVDLDVDGLRVIGLIGPSGCGKTTLVRMMNGVLTPDSGSVELLGGNPKRFGARERQRIGYLPQQPVLFPELSLWENLNFHASLAGVRFLRRRRLNELLEFVELGDDRKKKVHEASGGMQRRLALAATMVHRPEVLFLDEPTAGIDPILRKRIWERFRDLRDQGTLLVVTTQYVSEAGYCDEVCVLSEGRLVAMSAPEDLARSAHGGDLVEITTVDGLSDQLLTASGELDGVVSTERIGTHQARLVVTDAPTALTMLRDWLDSHHIATTAVEESATDYDDVFVRIVEGARGSVPEPMPMEEF